MPQVLDRTDINILNALQDDATIQLRKLAGLVNASAATCQRRIAALRASGILRKQVVLLDRAKVGMALTIFVSIELEKQNSALLGAFERLMEGEAEVLECYEVAGQYDFHLVVSIESMEAHSRLTRRLFTAHNNVRDFKSLFAMSCSKFETKILLKAEAANGHAVVT